MTKKLMMFAVVASLATASFAESSIEFSYAPEGAPVDWWGKNLVETYDVAIRIDNPSLKGFKVTSLSVPMPVEEGKTLFSNPKGWLSTELKLVRNEENVRVNDPDIMCVDGQIDGGTLSVNFAEPYVFTGEPVYIGYSYTIVGEETSSGIVCPEIAKKSIALVVNDNPDGFYLHTTRTQLKWDEQVSRFQGGGNSAMKVTIEGDFHDYASGITLSDLYLTKTGEGSTITATAVNCGLKPFTSIDYSYNVNGLTGNGTAAISGLGSELGSTAEFSFDIPAISAQGVYNLEVKIDKVNGEPNTSASASAVTNYTVADNVPVNRPLFEEYTGLWCGFCPRGYVALENLYYKYGPDFVAIAWHGGGADPMAITCPAANNPGGNYPTVFLNRKENFDPAYLYTKYPEASKIPVYNSIECKIKFADESQEQIEATATIGSVVDMEKFNYRIAYALIADGLTDATWGQHNYFTSDTPQHPYSDLPDPAGALFKGKKEYVMGLEYNDVLIAFPSPRGTSDGIPTSMKAFDTFSHSFTFNLADAVNTAGESLVQDKNKIRVIAMLIDGETGIVVNSCSSPYVDGKYREEGGSGVDSVIDTDAEVVSSYFYDLQGRKVAADARGVIIRVDTLSNGATRTAKTINR